MKVDRILLLSQYKSEVTIITKETERIINSTKATMAFEGLEASPEVLEIGKRYLNDEITANEAIEMIKELHNISPIKIKI